LVHVHGGPTASMSSALSLAIQFWTTRGFAVLDLNYRGSSGYGRAYRRALYGKWGVYDVDDAVAGALYVANLGRVDRDRLLIAGGSAGGYTALAAVAFRKVFAAAASHYGVSDPAALAIQTHKFESHYLDHLIAPYPAQRETYDARSPLAHAGQIQTPLIVFQGLEDAVVPPAQSEIIVEALRLNGIVAEYHAFPGE